MKKKYEIDMSEGRLVPKLLAFIVPVMLSGVLQLAFNAADLVVVGRFAGENALAAVGSNGALITLIVNVLMGMSTGTSVLVSNCFGAKDKENLQSTIQTSVLIAFFGGILFAGIGYFLSGVLLSAMGTPEDVLPLAELYLKIYFSGLPVIALYNFTSAVLRAVGDSRRPLLFLAIAGVLNVALNLFFVLVFHMDVAGVALATVLSQCVSTFLTLRCLVRADGIYHLELRHIRFSGRRFLRILRIGLPAGIQGSLYSVSNVLIQSSINSFGAVVMAGNSAAASVESFAFVVQDSVNQASVASVSQNMGARKYKRVEQAVLCCALLEIGLSLVAAGCMMLFRRFFLGIYTSDPEAVEAGCVRLMIMGAVYFTNGLQNMMGGVMRGHGYSLLPTAVTMTGICGIRILWLYTVFAAHHELQLVYLSYPVSWIITITVQAICYFSIRKKAYAKNEALYS